MVIPAESNSGWASKIAGNARLSGQLKRAAVDAVPLLIRTGRYPARA
jgi:hypothetical protein